MSADVLVFGAGMVAKPLVKYLLEHGYNVTVATRTVSKAERIIGEHENGSAVAFDITRDTNLDSLVSKCDLAISLLPYIYHPKIAESCIRNGKHMVTTSYVSDAMRALDKDARENGVILLNELGLDPGIDHMSAMKIIEEVHSKNGKIVSFVSLCGGLPAPEANDNPFGYKFSWSPKGVVMAGRNGARYLKNGLVINVEPVNLFASYYVTDIEGIGKLEVYPNRDSLPYIDLYGIKETKTMFRGTLRYPGWCPTWKKFVDCGLLSDEEMDVSGLSYREFMAKMSGCPVGRVKECLSKKLGLIVDDPIMYRFDWLGLFSDAPIPEGLKTPADILASILEEKLQYAPGERDMIILKHEFLAEYEDHREEITSLLIDYGIPNGDTSMARTVGLPAAIGAKLILEGKIDVSGVRIPVIREIYDPVLAELRRLGIRFHETRTPIP